VDKQACTLGDTVRCSEVQRGARRSRRSPNGPVHAASDLVLPPSYLLIAICSPTILNRCLKRSRSRVSR
jgi:hypothetical protein